MKIRSFSPWQPFWCLSNWWEGWAIHALTTVPLPVLSLSWENCISHLLYSLVWVEVSFVCANFFVLSKTADVHIWIASFFYLGYWGIFWVSMWTSWNWFQGPSTTEVQPSAVSSGSCLFRAACDTTYKESEGLEMLNVVKVPSTKAFGQLWTGWEMQLRGSVIAS